MRQSGRKEKNVRMWDPGSQVSIRNVGQISSFFFLLVLHSVAWLCCSSCNWWHLDGYQSSAGKQCPRTSSVGLSKGIIGDCLKTSAPEGEGRALACGEYHCHMHKGILGSQSFRAGKPV